jgi:hypothetical protein
VLPACKDGGALTNGYPKPSNPLDELLSGMAIVPAGPPAAPQPQPSPSAASAAVGAAPPPLERICLCIRPGCV